MSAYVSYWIVLGVVILVVYLILGAKINKKAFGILIDSRQKMSLSRFQIAVWTLVLLSAFLALALAKGTLAITLDPEVWALMGISIGSGAGAVIIKGNKEGKEPAAAIQSAIGAMPRVGLMHQNQSADEAGWTDMFKGEEVGDRDYIDIGKVQMFFFTLAAVVGYVAALWNANFADGALKFPELSQELVILLGISHTGYLTIKAAPKTPTESGAPMAIHGMSARFAPPAPANPPTPPTVPVTGGGKTSGN